MWRSWVDKMGYSVITDESKVCEAVVLYSLAKALAAAELFPLPHADDYSGSVDAIYRKLKDIASLIIALKTK